MQPATIATTATAPALPKSTDIPAELRSIRQWLCWNVNKEPCSLRSGRRCDGTKNSNWGTFEQAITTAQRKGLGVGFALGNAGLVGLDLDHAAIDGVPEPWAQDIIDQLLAAGAYVEWSPSGTGFHAIGRGRFPDGKDGYKTTSHLSDAHGTVDPAPTGDLKALRKLEAWNDKRYLTMTGRSFSSVDVLPDIQTALNAIVEHYGTPRNAEFPLPDTTAWPVLTYPKNANGVLRPGDDFNQRGDVPELLKRHGWVFVRNVGDNTYWRRPGKANGVSASFNGTTFYCFTSSAPGLQCETGYAPFRLYADLEHRGDFSAAASALAKAGFGASDTPAVFVASRKSTPASSPPVPEYPDPGPLPVALLRIPGFISEVMDHCLETAPYPNVALAFCGALALQSLLGARKVRDQGDNRTNLYLLALGFSSVGKDWPRKLNTTIMHRVGLISSLGDKFASGEGIQDALFRSPAMLYQTDEFDGLLLSINKSRDSRHENILNTLLTMYSSANSIYPMRSKAGEESPGVIEQPCLTVLGTAIPTHYYEALSLRMLTNGFFARMIIVESGVRSAGQEPRIIDPSERILETARWWSEFQTSSGNLTQFHPEPKIIMADGEARELLNEARLASEADYAKAESRGDPVGTTVFGRVPEQIRKLSLLYAISASHKSPLIDSQAVRWATDFIMHQTGRMLFMARNHVADNPFHANCLKLKQKLRVAPDRSLDHSTLLKRMKVDAKTFQDLIQTLNQQGDLAIETAATDGRTGTIYKLLSDD